MVGFRRSILARKGEGGVEAVIEEFAVRQAGEAVMHRVMEQALLGGLHFGDVR